MSPNDSVLSIKGVGPEVAKKLKLLNLRTVQDVIEYYPRKYNDFSNVQQISDINPGSVTVKAVIKQAKGRYVRRGMHITEAVASDESGSVRLVWFNQPYRAASLKRDQEYYISGEFALRRQKLSIQNPSIELVSSFPVNTARLIPIYKETKGIKSHQIRKIIKECLQVNQAIEETLPEWIMAEYNLVSRDTAIKQMHFPDSAEKLKSAIFRLGFEEVFQLTLAALLNKYELDNEKSIVINFDEQIAKQFVSSLPFKLTDAQKKAIWQIYKDLQKDSPMNRLLEGDVGSGKTIVAVMAAIMAMKNGYQAALMAPTEILARQHAETIYQLLENIGWADKVGLLVGGINSSKKKSLLENINTKKIQLIVGTHALIQEDVDMHNLGLVIVDEQHRFGVEQRKALQKKAGVMPHVLSMTATPIPRSLALTLYGEMDITIVDTKPEGRKPIITKIISPNSKKQLYQEIDSQLELGRQMFVVAPLIKESDSLNAVSAEEMHKELAGKHFKHRSVGLLHGKMKAEEKDKIMQSFLAHELDILVSTTVIEVGVNVPNASIMLIENADRFGLAQIHQLRGRVGRGSYQGYCYLVMSDSSEPNKRLRALEQSDDGFQLAELDLEIRGPGAIYGTMQHGQLDLRVAKLSDTKLIASARQAAQSFIERGYNLLEYKHLHKHVAEIRKVTNLN